MISEFLDCELTDGKGPDCQLFQWDYEGPKLKYQINIDTRTKNLVVSADPDHPFGFESLIEVVVNFDSIGIETEPQFYGDQKILVARRNYPKEENFKVLMIMKWPSGELSIWPNNYEAAQAAIAEFHSEN